MKGIAIGEPLTDDAAQLGALVDLVLSGTLAARKVDVQADGDTRYWGVDVAQSPILDRLKAFGEERFARATGAPPARSFVMVNHITAQKCPGGSGGGWHRDSLRPQFKAFAYLTPVDKEARGPLCFLPASNGFLFRVVSAVHRVLSGRNRYSDRAIDLAIRAGVRSHPVFQKAGVPFFLNTSLIHRGLPISEGHRIAATVYMASAADDVGEYASYEVGAQARPIDFDFLVETLSALDAMRRDQVRAEAVYLDRIAGFAASDPAASASFDRGKTSGTIGSPFLAAARTLWLAIARMAASVALAPAFISQSRILDAMRPSSRAGSRLALAVASSRLSLGGPSPRPRERLALLARALGGGPSGEVARQVASASSIFLFDALAVSGFWRHRKESWGDDMIIVDGAFLNFVILRGFLKDCAGKLRLAAKCFRRPNPLRILYCALAADAYSEILGGSLDMSAIFFTNNSTLTEVLRAFLIQWDGCRRIDEVMHGIATVPGERYFDALLAKSEGRGSYAKHFFIPQVPVPPLYGIFERQARRGEPAAVNTYLNQYLADHPEIRGRPRLFIEREYAALRSENAAKADPIVLTIFGNCPYDGRLFDSPSFKSECLLIAAITRVQKEAARDSLLVYVPHPIFRGSRFEHPVIIENRVKIYRDSIFCWLVSDLCVSLFSSAMFEGAYFGARAFTPMLAADGFFTQQYLDLLSHPRSASQGDLRAALREFVVGFRRDEAVVSRAERRLEMMQSSPAAARAAAAGP